MANIVTYEARDGQEVELTFETIKKFLVHGKPDLVTNQEMIFFIGICKARGLNPFAKDCYLIKYSDDPAAVITSIDYFRARAKAQPDCKGWNAGIIVKDTKSGEVRNSKGLISETEELVGGWFKARPEGWDTDFELEVNIPGYLKKTKAGSLTKFWSKENQPTMIRKVAESQGLRECWPDEFAKIYLEEEIDRSEIRDTHFTSKQEQAIEMTAAIKNGKTVESGVTYETKVEEKTDIEKAQEKLDEKRKEVEGKKKDPDQEIIDQFVGFRKPGKNLLLWEKSNRAALNLMSDKVQEAFFEKFENVMDISYPKWLTNQESGGPLPDDEGQGKGTEENVEPGQENGNNYISCPKNNQQKKHFQVCQKCTEMGKCQPFKEWEHENNL